MCDLPGSAILSAGIRALHLYIFLIYQFDYKVKPQLRITTITAKKLTVFL